MQLADMSLRAFSSALASGEPVPGGGSVAAVHGAMGACLSSMVCALTLGRARFAQHQELAANTQAQAKALEEKFLDAIDADAQAFSKVGAVFAMPRESEQDKEQRRQAMQQALMGSCLPPLEVMELCVETLSLVCSLVGKSNENAVSDLGVAALSLKAALQSGWLNLRINLAAIRDEDFVLQHHRQGELLLKRGCAQADAIYEMVLGSLG